MRKVHSRDTTPEMLLRRALWSRGVRYRLCRMDLPGKPDIVFPSRRLCVFVDGDFWHGNQWRRRGLPSLDDQFRDATNRDYWLKKIRRNVERDRRVTAELLAAGWTVVRLWESDIHADLERCTELVRAAREKCPTQPAGLLPQKTFAEFFAGIGLMRIGLEKGGWSVAFANDIAPDKYEMYAHHFGDVDSHYVVGDVHELAPEAVPPLTLATASFPCNDLSLAGAREGLKGKQSSAYWGFIRVLKGMACRPPLVLLENVPGFLTSHGGRDFEEAIKALADLGYSVDTFTLDAASFVPQSRQRLFVLGVLSELLTGSGVEVTEDAVRPRPVIDFISRHPHLPWHHRPMPVPPAKGPSLDTIIENPPKGSDEWWTEKRATYLLNQMSDRHRKTADEMIAGKKWSYGTVFRRMRFGKSMAELRTDGIAGCLRTPRGGSARQILFRAGRGRYDVRFVNPREAARLMGAGEYRMNGLPLNQALFGFGDAVCVPVIEWIATQYLNPLVDELMRGRVLTPQGGKKK